jgi:hypothetical protein
MGIHSLSGRMRLPRESWRPQSFRNQKRRAKSGRRLVAVMIQIRSGRSASAKCGGRVGREVLDQPLHPVGFRAAGFELESAQKPLEIGAAQCRKQRFPRSGVPPAAREPGYPSRRFGVDRTGLGRRRGRSHAVLRTAVQSAPRRAVVVPGLAAFGLPPDVAPCGNVPDNPINQIVL